MTSEDIYNKLQRLYEAQPFAFKINVSYGFVFEEEVDDGDYYLYSIGHGCDDDRILDTPMIIRNKKDFNALINKINVLDFAEFAKKTREGSKNSRIKALGIYQLFVKIYLLHDPIGAQIQLPEPILNSKLQTPYTQH